MNVPRRIRQVVNERYSSFEPEDSARAVAFYESPGGRAVAFGVRFPATGTLLWFSPAAGQAPAPVPLTSPEHGEIVVEGVRVPLDRHADEWTVGTPQRVGAPSGAR